MITLKNQLHNIVLPIGDITHTGFSITGTCFQVANGIFCTAYHNIAGLAKLGIILPKITSINDFQDYSDKSCNFMEVEIYKTNPHRDIVLLKIKNQLINEAKILNFASLNILEKTTIVGYPYSAEDANGRFILTFQESKIGSKILMQSELGSVKSKNYILNVQTRPGQSGSPVFDRNYNLIAMIIGGFKYKDMGIMLGNIDPSSLNQTTYAISSEYIGEML
jgi:V8-like Glu-specific endopeptidase